MKTEEIKPGFVFNICWELVRQVEHDEKYWDAAQQCEVRLSNPRGNLWWAKPKIGSGPSILVCSDEL